jgi:nanoRNase/pAp phosphatase (c-di-AMP/oligoRNAs hydrolase)/predicted transcriptional regulator
MSVDAFQPTQKRSMTRRPLMLTQLYESNKKETSSSDKSSSRKPLKAYSAQYLDDNGLKIVTDTEGRVTARPKEEEATEVGLVDENDININEDLAKVQQKKQKPTKPRPSVKEQPAQVVPISGFNVVLTHCTADFDSLASAVGLAKLWSSQHSQEKDKSEYDSASNYPTFVVLPRGAHPSVQRFLALHKHLFPIRSLRSLPSDLSGLNRLGLVDAQRRDRIGPAEHLLDFAKRITVVDHHLDSESDIASTDFILDKVGSVSTLIVERLMEADLDEGLTEAEATLLALGIHADTGSLCYDSTTPRDALALAWVMAQGASQAAIAEHAHSSLSHEQQGALTQALINTNSTVVHGVTVSTVLLTADGFINGLAAVAQDALELSSSDIYLLGLVYEARSGGSGKNKNNKPGLRQSRLLLEEGKPSGQMYEAEGWKGGEEALLRQRLRAAFDRKDTDRSGFLERNEIAVALAASGIIASDNAVNNLMTQMDTNGDGKVDFEEFVVFGKDAEEMQKQSTKKASTLIIIGRVKAGVNLKSVKLGKLLEKFGGGGHPKAASATVRLNDEAEAAGVMSGLVEELIETSLQEQPTVGDFMTAPVLSVSPDLTERQVEDLFTRYDVRALPVVDENNIVIGLVTYKEVAAAKQRLFNKEQKRARQAAKQQQGKGDQNKTAEEVALVEERRKRGSTVKGWMKQHIKTVEQSMTMAEVENMLLENDIGCIPVVADGTMQLLGMVTRTDLLRQHRYYPSLHYHNKGFSDSIAARKPIIELRKKLKQFDLENE